MVILQYCDDFCHTSTRVSHRYTCSGPIPPDFPRATTVILIHVSVYNPLQHPAATLGFTLFLCFWFPATLIHVGVWGNGSFSPAWCFLSCLIYGSLVFILHFGKFLAIVTSSIFFCSIHLSFSF